LIRVRGDARTALFAEDGVLKKELPRVPRLSEFSPDGSRLLEVRFSNGASDLFVSDADGSHARQVARGVNFQDEAHWSHDGTRILYASSRGGYQVFEADARGGVLRKLARGGGVVSEPAYTPDRHVSYILRRADTKQKLPPSSLVATDGTTERVIIEGRPLTSYAWEPSGPRLAFSTYEDGGLIVTRDLASGAERTVKLTDVDARLGGFVAHDIRWRPDGGAVAFTLSFAGGRWQGDKEVMFGERQLFVLYSDGRVTWFDVEEEYSIFDWIPADDTAK
jgi:Tol biopolymer transport system component